MPMFRKRPIVIEAVQWNGLDEQAVADFVGTDRDLVTNHEGAMFIQTLEGKMRADTGDWIIRGVKGELYPCKPDIFDATYEGIHGDAVRRGTDRETMTGMIDYLKTEPGGIYSPAPEGDDTAKPGKS